MTKMIESAGNNLRTDIMRLSSLAKEYLGEKQAIVSLQGNIAQREAELAKTQGS